MSLRNSPARPRIRRRRSDPPTGAPAGPREEDQDGDERASRRRCRSWAASQAARSPRRGSREREQPGAGGREPAARSRPRSAGPGTAPGPPSAAPPAERAGRAGSASGWRPPGVITRTVPLKRMVIDTITRAAITGGPSPRAASGRSGSRAREKDHHGETDAKPDQVVHEIVGAGGDPEGSRVVDHDESQHGQQQPPTAAASRRTARARSARLARAAIRLLSSFGLSWPGRGRPRPARCSPGTCRSWRRRDSAGSCRALAPPTRPSSPPPAGNRPWTIGTAPSRAAAIRSASSPITTTCATGPMASRRGAKSSALPLPPRIR